MLRWIFHQVYICCRRYNKGSERRIVTSSLPWLWIGAKYSDKTVPVTSVVNDAIRYGDCVDDVFLADCTGLHPVSWVYLKSKTLEEDIFPSTGIVIENDSGK